MYNFSNFCKWPSWFSSRLSWPMGLLLLCKYKNALNITLALRAYFCNIHGALLLEVIWLGYVYEFNIIIWEFLHKVHPVVGSFLFYIGWVLRSHLKVI